MVAILRDSFSDTCFHVMCCTMYKNVLNTTRKKQKNTTVCLHNERDILLNNGAKKIPQHNLL